MTSPDRVYLDHAATSWPKSDDVLRAMDEFARTCGAAAGRGSYRSAVAAGGVVAGARRKIAELIAAPSPNCVTFHGGGTEALNAAIHGMVRPGDHVVTTAAEHNSVLRPLHFLQTHHGVQVTVVEVDKDGTLDPDSLLNQITEKTRLVAVTAASNVTGTVQPIETIGRRLADHAALFLCDAAQTFGCLPIDVEDTHIDLLAAPGHKGSGGPAGTGFLYVAPAWHEQIRPLVQGGTGSDSESLEMPQAMPGKLEAGNLNVPAIAGWLAALRAIDGDSLTQRQRWLAQLSTMLHEQMNQIDGVRVIGKPGPLPIASLNLNGWAPTDASLALDTHFSIETRAGLHCAARIHDHLGTSPQGTLRISGGETTTILEIQAAIDAVKSLAEAMQN